jgi:hypothetical protein
MSFKGKLGVILVVLGFISIPFVRFGGEFLLLSAFFLVFGALRVGRELGGPEKLRSLIDRPRREAFGSGRSSEPRIDPLLPVRVLKLAEARAGSLTVSAVAMALNVGLDECQLALDDLVRKGAATVDVDLSTGVATYRFPEFLPHVIDGASPI